MFIWWLGESLLVALNHFSSPVSVDMYVLCSNSYACLLTFNTIFFTRYFVSFKFRAINTESALANDKSQVSFTQNRASYISQCFLEHFSTE